MSDKQVHLEYAHQTRSPQDWLTRASRAGTGAWLLFAFLVIAVVVATFVYGVLSRSREMDMRDRALAISRALEIVGNRIERDSGDSYRIEEVKRELRELDVEVDTIEFLYGSDGRLQGVRVPAEAYGGRNDVLKRWGDWKD